MLKYRQKLKKIRNDIDDMVVSDFNIESAVFGVVNPSGDIVKRYQKRGEELFIVDDGPDISIPLKLGYLLKPRMTKVVYGGRGSGKTRTIAAILIDRARVETHRILCCREIQKSISDSSKQELEDEIARRGLSGEFRITDKRITHLKTKSYFVFEGLLRNDTKIKGYANITICWVEEAENVSKKSWDSLEPTIRAEGAETWISFNPRLDEDPTFVEYVAPYLSKMSGGVYDGEDDDVIVIRINYDENPWFTKTLRKKMERMKKTDFDRYCWIWLGQFWDRKESQVFQGKWVVEDFDIPIDVNCYYGADWGFANDPTTLIKIFVKDECLYICDEIFEIGLGLDETRDRFLDIDGAHSHIIRADCARPETISHLAKKWTSKDGNLMNGYRITGAKKWPGSVEDGINYIRSFKKIYIHPRCEQMIYEASNYCYEVDRITDDVLPKVKDANNHGWDAIRYALNVHILQSKQPRIPLAGN